MKKNIYPLATGHFNFKKQITKCQKNLSLTDRLSKTFFNKKSIFLFIDYNTNYYDVKDPKKDYLSRIKSLRSEPKELNESPNKNLNFMKRKRKKVGVLRRSNTETNIFKSIKGKNFFIKYYFDKIGKKMNIIEN